MIHSALGWVPSCPGRKNSAGPWLAIPHSVQGVRFLRLAEVRSVARKPYGKQEANERNVSSPVHWSKTTDHVPKAFPLADLDSTRADELSGCFFFRR